MSSPSEFLTFMRHASTQTSRVRLAARTPLTRRPFSLSTVRPSNFGTGKAATEEFQKDTDHATDKKDQLDVQSDSSAKARESHAQDEGGAAARGKDERGSVDKTKEEFPESPTQIGMQDERGGKGHS